MVRRDKIYKASFVDTISFKKGQVAIRGTYQFNIAKIIHSSERVGLSANLKVQLSVENFAFLSTL